MNRARQNIDLISRGVWIELIRRKDLYVLAMLMGIFGFATFTSNLVGINEPETATFLFNMGLTLCHLFAHILVAMLILRQLPTDLESRSLYPILARPVSRRHYLLGKWWAAGVGGVLTYVLFVSWIFLTVPRMEDFSAMLFLQTFLLQVGSLFLFSAAGLLLSLIFPRAVGLLILAGAILIYQPVTGLLRSVSSGELASGLMNWWILLWPDFTKLNLTTRFTDGLQALSLPVFVGLLGQVFFFTLLCLHLSQSCFERRAL
ncbi:hypothetical protein P0Y35_10850 [Kiritimatiellaeota bacterium B1221]|nr:hypothetical protein [Kiritimatiellaeota bacterium B1221]